MTNTALLSNIHVLCGKINKYLASNKASRINNMKAIIDYISNSSKLTELMEKSDVKCYGLMKIAPTILHDKALMTDIWDIDVKTISKEDIATLFKIAHNYPDSTTWHQFCDNSTFIKDIDMFSVDIMCENNYDIHNFARTLDFLLFTEKAIDYAIKHKSMKNIKFLIKSTIIQHAIQKIDKCSMITLTGYENEVENYGDPDMEYTYVPAYTGLDRSPYMNTYNLELPVITKEYISSIKDEDIRTVIKQMMDM